MRVTTVRIENFRGIVHLELALDNVTVLIGENNSGKTAVLDALRLCLRELGPRRQVVFDAFDFHLPDERADPASADPIQIEIEFSEQRQGEWGDPLTGRLTRARILQVGEDQRNQVLLRVTCSYDAERQDFAQDWAFLNLERNPLHGISDPALAALQREVSFFYLSALRDAGRHFDARGPFWRRFLRGSELPADKKTEIEQKLREVNDLVVGSHASFEQVRAGLRKVQEVVPLADGDVVSVEAVPGRTFDMLAKAQLHLATPTGAKLPVHRHGEGTQSLAVLMLFSAFLQSEVNGTPLIALEEPEAHLHPSAVRALWRLVCDFAGQKVISTHSGDLLAETEVSSIRRLARSADGVSSFRVAPGLLSKEETRKFDYHVRRARGELLFARAWLLVEGETEAWIYPAAARALGLDLHRQGVRVVEYRQSNAGLLAKIADALGIAWHCVGDDDEQRERTERSLTDAFDGAYEARQLVFPYRNIETHLLSNGYDGVYRRHMPRQNAEKMTKKPGDAGYWDEYAGKLPSRAKTHAAADVAIEMEKRGVAGVTREIRNALEKVVELAGGVPDGG